MGVVGGLLLGAALLTFILKYHTHMSTAYADLESRNQQLQLRVIELEAEQAIYEQFKRQTVEELEALRRAREVLEQKHTELKREIMEERQQYA